MARSKSGIERETRNGKPIWRTPSGEVVVLGAPTIKLPEPKPKSYYGRRARFDCCTDCGAHVEFGKLWCDNCRYGRHDDPAGREAEAGHGRTLQQDRTLTKPW